MAEKLKEQDVKSALKLATNATKKLVMAGINGDADFPTLLAKYKWSGTRDYNMALIIIAFYAFCMNPSGINDQYIQDIKNFGLTAQRKGNNTNRLLEYLKEGNGKKIKNYMGMPFMMALDTVLKNALPDDDDKDKRAKIIKDFIKQAGKIKPWIINGSIIANLLLKLSNGKISAPSGEQFLNSIMNGKTQNVNKMLANNTELANAENKDGKTALMCAVISGNTDIVKTLLEKDIDINAKDKDGKTALIHSIATSSKNRVDIAKMLIDKHADVTIKDGHGNTVSSYLQQGRINEAERKELEETIIYVKLAENRKKEISELKERKIVTNAIKEKRQKETIYENKIEENRNNKPKIDEKEEIQKLLKLYENKIDELKGIMNSITPKSNNTESETKLLNAIKSNNLNDIKDIIKTNSNSNILNTPLDTMGNTALHFAVLKHDLQLVNLLLENGADPNIPNNNKKYLDLNIKYLTLPGGNPPKGSTAFGLAALLYKTYKLESIEIYKKIRNFNYKQPVNKDLLNKLTRYEHYLSNFYDVHRY